MSFILLILILKHSVESADKKHSFSFNSQEKIKGEMNFTSALIVRFCHGVLFKCCLCSLNANLGSLLILLSPYYK